MNKLCIAVETEYLIIEGDKKKKFTYNFITEEKKLVC